MKNAFAFAAALCLAAPVFASGALHSANTEMGYTVHPDHATAGLSRAQVREELQAAMRQPSWAQLRVGAAAERFEPKLTRAQVQAELQRAQQHPSWAARRVGAPVSMN